MTTAHTPDGLIGASVLRVEDPVLLTGKGCYTDDIQLPGMLHMALLRSPYPHAKIMSINTSLAQAMPGIEANMTGADLVEHLRVPVIPMVPGMQIPPHPLLWRWSWRKAARWPRTPWAPSRWNTTRCPWL